MWELGVGVGYGCVGVDVGVECGRRHTCGSGWFWRIHSVGQVRLGDKAG